MSGLEVPALSVRQLSKTFGATRVLSNADVELRAGEVHALVGENGSGKSTLVKILAGYHEPDPGGTIEVAGSAYLHGAGSADSAGLRFVHQDLGLVHELNVLDNMALGHGYHVGVARRILWREEARAAQKALLALGYDIDVQRLVGDLSTSERTAVAVARALSPRQSAAKVLILDEPTANLSAPEVEHLFVLLRRIKDSGVAILFISHHFNEVFNLADRVTVLRDGHMIATRDVSDLHEDELIALMIGRSLEAAEPNSSTAQGRELVLRIAGLHGKTVHGLDLDVMSGEVVGIAGITGSGREEVASLVSGGAGRRGSVHVLGGEIFPNRPDLAIKHGVASVPAERKTNATLNDHTVRENMTISSLKPYVSGLRLRRDRERADVALLLDSFDVRPRASEAMIDALSGGNQQKVMLARAMRLNSRLLVLDEPTQGVDVGAQAEIHHLIRDAASRGTAVLVCSSTSEELAEVADRVLVLSGGRCVDEFHSPVDPDRITAACLKLTQDVDQ